jgi:hypothetical protein
MSSPTQNSWNSDYPFLDGQVIIGQDGDNAVANTLTPDFGIEIDNAPGSITIRATGQAQVVKVTVDTSMAEDRNYITDGATELQMTLPETIKLGSIFTVTDVGEGFRIRQNAGQFIRFGNKVTTTGTDGNVRTVQDGSSITFMCTEEDTEFNVISSVGNFQLDTTIA